MGVRRPCRCPVGEGRPPGPSFPRHPLSAWIRPVASSRGVRVPGGLAAAPGARRWTQRPWRHLSLEPRVGVHALRAPPGSAPQGPRGRRCRRGRSAPLAGTRGPAAQGLPWSFSFLQTEEMALVLGGWLIEREVAAPGLPAQRSRGRSWAIFYIFVTIAFFTGDRGPVFVVLTSPVVFYEPLQMMADT